MATMDKYELLNAETFTFNNDGSITAPEVMVGLVSSDTVGLGAAEDKIFGKAWRLDDRGVVMVQYAGMIVSPYSGTAPTVGAGQELVLDGAGNVKLPATAGTGTNVDIVSVDTTNGLVAFVIR